MKKLMKNLTKYLKKYCRPHLQKKIFTRAGRRKQIFFILALSLVDSLPYTCSRTIFLTRSQNNVLWILCAEELKIVCFAMIVFICKVVTLIFFVLAE